MDDDRTYHVYTAKAITDPSVSRIGKAARILGHELDSMDNRQWSGVMQDLRETLEEEGEPLAEHLTFDEAFRIGSELEGECRLKIRLMEDCPDCGGKGGFTGHSMRRGIPIEQDADCGACNGLGVVIVPEGE